MSEPLNSSRFDQSGILNPLYSQQKANWSQNFEGQTYDPEINSELMYQKKAGNIGNSAVKMSNFSSTN